MKKISRKRVVAYIDSENISAKEYDVISAIINREGKLAHANVYGIKNDKCTKNWSDVAKNQRALKDIRLSGGPAKNKVDKRIIRDMYMELKNNDDIDVVVLVSSDHGYSQAVRDLKETGKEVIIVGRNISESLKKAGNAYCEIE